MSSRPTIPNGAAPANRRPGERSLRTDLTYWAAMYASSALGTNSGDLWAAALGDGHRALSGAVMLGLCAVAIRTDRRRTGSEAWFWVAIVLLRTGATNFADLMTHDWDLSFWKVSLASGASTLALALLTRPSPSGRASPALDVRFWLTMLLVGLFGTVTGDLGSHEIGRPLAATVLLAMLGAALLVRRHRFAASLLAYWVVVGCVRAAGTPLGDTLASTFGLGAAAVLSSLLLAAALVWRSAKACPRVVNEAFPSRSSAATVGTT